MIGSSMEETHKSAGRFVQNTPSLYEKAVYNLRLSILSFWESLTPDIIERRVVHRFKPNVPMTDELIHRLRIALKLQHPELTASRDIVQCEIVIQWRYFPKPKSWTFGWWFER